MQENNKLIAEFIGAKRKYKPTNTRFYRFR